MPEFPKRPLAHQLEDISENFFRAELPSEWAVNRFERDYGRDLLVEITQGEELRGEEFIVQLKASANSTITNHEMECQVFKTSTYNYLKAKLSVVMIVKYIQSENEAYWVWLRDIPEPNPNQDTFTIHIPRVNCLSRIDWRDIVSHVDAVTGAKLEIGLALRNTKKKRDNTVS